MDDSVFYEAKVKQKKKVLYLIFNTRHALFRTEIPVKFSVIPKHVREKVLSDLSKRFLKYAIKANRRLHISGEIMYEIELVAKEKSVKKKYLFLYDHDGVLANFKEFPQKSIGQVFHKP